MKTAVKKKLMLSKSFIKFLYKIRKQSNIARIIASCIELRDAGLGNIADHVLSAEDVNYITYRNNGMISYMPASKDQAILDDGTWAKEGRQEGKPSKVIRKVFSKKILTFFKETDFEIFNNRYKAEFVDHGYKFEVLDNTEIPGVYCHSYQSENGAIGDSCMRNDDELVQFYSSVNGLRIVTLINPKDTNHEGTPLLVGRALLWRARRSDGVMIDFMDRVYAEDDVTAGAFVVYAKENGWWTKEEYMSRGYEESLINPSTEEVEEWQMTVNVNLASDEGPFPYIDTFHWGRHSHLQNYESGAFYEFGDTGGARYVRCAISEDWCAEDSMTEVGMGRYEGQMVSNDEVVYSDYHNCYLVRDEAYRVCGEYYHESEVERAA